MATIRARVGRVKDDPGTMLEPDVVRTSFRTAGCRWRERVLDPASTMKALALQVLHGNTAIGHVVRLMGGGFTESAYCQARARLPIEAMQGVLEAFTARARRAGSVDDASWLGHRVILIDGTGVSVPDTPSHRAMFGTASGCREGCGLPLVRTLIRFDAHSGLLLNMHVAPATTHDLRYAHELHPALRPGDVVVGDRGLCAYTQLAMLAARGCHGVFRLSDSRLMPFPASPGPRQRNSYNRHRRADHGPAHLTG